MSIEVDDQAKLSGAWRELDESAILRSSCISFTIGADFMKQSTWAKPDFEEVSLNCEINSYTPVEI